MIGRRPKPEPALDQVHLTEESLLRKAHLLICKGYVLGKNVVFIGDDDFLSLAVLRIVSARHGESALSKCRVSVFDIDDRIVTEIGNLAKDLALPVQAYQADARESLKEDLRGSFDVAITDPPYTVKGTEIFLERCLDALSSDGGRIILSKGGKAGSDQLALQRFWSSRNLVLTEFYPGYNKYQGGSILAGQSDLYFLIRVPENRGQREDLPGPFYTIEAGTGARPYFCTACGHKVLVGPNAGIGTIQNLKELGCPVCSGTKFRYAPKQGKKE